MKSNANWVADHCVSDWVRNDKRSVAAMLNGTGDERGSLYEDFCKIMQIQNSNINQRHIDLKYSEFIAKKEKEFGCPTKHLMTSSNNK